MELRTAGTGKTMGQLDMGLNAPPRYPFFSHHIKQVEALVR